MKHVALTALAGLFLAGASFIAPGWADDAALRSEYGGVEITLPPVSTTAPRPDVITTTVEVIEQATAVSRHTTSPAPTTTTTTTIPGPPQPINGDCDSWRPLLEFYELPWDLFQPVLWRESRCRNAHASDSDDESFGGLQVNRIGNLAAAWDSLGFTLEYMQTSTGAIHAAGVLFIRCGFGPWDYQYDCGFPHGALTRWEWPS